MSFKEISLNFYKNIILLAFFVFYGLGVFAQDKQKTEHLYFFNYELYTGKFIENSHVSKDFFPNNYVSYDLKFGVKTFGKKYWHESLNYLSYGFGINHSFLNTEVLGNPFAVYVFLNGPFFTYKKFSVNYEFNNGISFNPTYYDKETNPNNDLVGSLINYYANIRILMRYQISERFDIDAGVHLLHNSNGAFALPNYGLNVYGISMGLKYYFTDAKTDVKFIRQENTIFKGNIPEYRKNIWSGFFVLGAKRAATPKNDSPLYPMWSVAANYHRRYSISGSYGIGVDALYDGTVHTFKGYENATEFEKIFYGVHLSHIIYISKFSVVTQLGAYVSEQSIKDLIWARLAIRYHFAKNLFIQSNFKTKDGLRADFIGIGVGVSF